MRSASAPQRLSASAPQRLSASAPQRLSASIPAFLNLIIFNSVLMLVASGCGGRDGQGLPQPGPLLAAEPGGGPLSLPLVPSETNLNLGRVASGGQESRTFWLMNRSAAPVEVVQITTSCDCLRIELPNRLLAPGQKVEGHIKLDLQKEPEFAGNLGISVEGKGNKGETVFEMEVHVTVDDD